MDRLVRKPLTALTPSPPERIRFMDLLIIATGIAATFIAFWIITSAIERNAK